MPQIVLAGLEIVLRAPRDSFSVMRGGMSNETRAHYKLYLQDLYKIQLVMSDSRNIVRELYLSTWSELSSDD